MRCKAIAERGDPLLIVGGGDGTISAAASALVGTETQLGILPLGTLNHFARDLGIPDRPRRSGAADRERQRAPRRRRRDERPHLHQQQRDRPLSADGRRPRPAAEAARPEQAPGDGRRLAPNARPVQPPAPDADRQRRARRGSTRRCCSSATTIIGSTSARPASARASMDGELCVLVMRKKTRRGLDRGEHPRLVQPLAARRHGPSGRSRAAAGREPPRPAGGLAGRRSGPRRAAARLPHPQEGASGHRALNGSGMEPPGAAHGSQRDRSGLDVATQARHGMVGHRPGRGHRASPASRSSCSASAPRCFRSTRAFPPT